MSQPLPSDVVGRVVEAALARLERELPGDPELHRLARELFESGDVANAKLLHPALLELAPPTGEEAP